MSFFWMSNSVTDCCWVMTPQSGRKAQFYSTLYYITLNSYCEAQGVSNNLKKAWKYC